MVYFECFVSGPGVNPGFLERGFKFTKGGGGGFDLSILPDYLFIFPDYSENFP